MKEIDWSKAPEGATHYCAEQTFRGVDYGEHWLKPGFYCCPCDEFWTEDVCRVPDEILVERPKQAWSGEGLPPIRTVCEYQRNDVSYRQAWMKVIPMYFGETLVFLQHWASGNEYTEVIENCVFRPIKTQEQVAAEEREKAIKEMYNKTKAYVSSYSNEVQKQVCADLYDAGYRLTKIEE